MNISVRETLASLRRLAQKKAGQDFALNDEHQTNQVIIARAFLLLLTEKAKK